MDCAVHSLKSVVLLSVWEDFTLDLTVDNISSKFVFEFLETFP